MRRSSLQQAGSPKARIQAKGYVLTGHRDVRTHIVTGSQFNLIVIKNAGILVGKSNPRLLIGQASIRVVIRNAHTLVNIMCGRPLSLGISVAPKTNGKRDMSKLTDPRHPTKSPLGIALTRVDMEMNTLALRTLPDQLPRTPTCHTTMVKCLRTVRLKTPKILTMTKRRAT